MPPSPDPQPIAITLFGAGGSGKSSLTLSLVRSAFTSTYDPTIEDSYSITRRIDGTEYLITITDTAGQEEYRGLWAQEALMADGFVLVYDITNRGSLEQLEWFEGLVRVEGECREERAEALARQAALYPEAAQEAQAQVARSRRGTGGGGQRSRRGTGTTAAPPDGLLPSMRPVKIVAGNKVDLANSRQVPAREGLEWARRHGCGFMETSARERVNVEETFGLIVRRVVEARREEEQRRLEEEYAMQQARRAEERGAGRYGIAGGGDGRRFTVDWSQEAVRYQEAYGQDRGNQEERERGDDRERRSERERERRVRRRRSEAGVGIRHAPTAPLSPLEPEGEKRMRLPIQKGDIGPTKKGWSWLRCW